MRRSATQTEGPPGRPALRIHQEVARALGTGILAGRHPPGALLPGEIEHSADLGVSRTVYREAVRILTAKGMIESRPKVGTRVTPRTRWNLLDPQVLEWAFAEGPDARFTRDLFELRAVIEPAAAAFAADRHDEAQRGAMAEALRDMRSNPFAGPAWRDADRRFHRSILEASGNEALAVLAGSIETAVDLTTQAKQRAAAPARDPVEEHQAVFEAIAAREAERARAAMAALVALAGRDMGIGGR